MNVALLLSPDESLKREVRRLWDSLPGSTSLLQFHTTDELAEALTTLGEVELVLVDLAAPSPGRIVGAPVIGLLPPGAPKPDDHPCLERPLRATELQTLRELLADASHTAGPDLAGARERALTRFISGIAHDINNRLATLTGYISMLPEIVQGEEEMIEDMEIAADAAADLIRQWQAFKDQEPMPPHPMDLAETLASLRGLLPRLIHPDARLTCEAPSSGLPIQGDPAGVEFLIVGLLGWFAGEKADIRLTAAPLSDGGVALTLASDAPLPFTDHPDWQRDQPVYEHILQTFGASWRLEPDTLRLHFQTARP